MTKLVAVLGSVTPPGRLSAAMQAAVDNALAAGHEATLLDLGTLRLGFADGRPLDQLDDDSASFAAQVDAAEAVILATPVYRASLTGALKNALDLLPIEALMGKPVGIVAMGATDHHFLGAASHLRDILAWFGALTCPTDVYLKSADLVEGHLTPEALASLDALVATACGLAAATTGSPLGPRPFAARS